MDSAPPSVPDEPAPIEDDRSPHDELADKIARLVAERGWNQEDFRRIANLNRQTVRTIMLPGPKRKLRNATVSACARALGLPVSELVGRPLEELLPLQRPIKAGVPEAYQRILNRATQPELRAWAERNADRARRMTLAEADELLEMQGPDGPLARFGVDHFVDLFERRRTLLDRVRVVAKSEYLTLMEQFVAVLYEKVRPDDHRAS